MTERTFSFEFFPPKTAEGAEKLRATRKQLAQLNPKFFSVTFGAGGSTRDRTLETVREIQADGSEAAPHLSCIGSTEDSIRDILNEYKSQGIRHLVALRGDLPSGTMDAGEFNYANELVAFIRRETGDWFEIEVAAYPEIHPQARSWTPRWPSTEQVTPRGQLVHTPAILVPQERHLPSARLRAVTAKMSRSTTAFLQLGHQVVSAPSRPGTLPI